MLQNQLKDISSVYDEKFAILIKLIEQKKFYNCKSIATDLIKLAWNLELKEEVFVCEVLEGIFYQISEPVFDYVMPEKDSSDLIGNLKKHMENIKQNYKGKNMSGIYENLREMRYIATHYQFLAQQSYAKKQGGSYYSRENEL